MSKCARGHVAYKPKRGDALLFFDMKPDYISTDESSMHTGCPVVEGVKWNAVKWLHGVPFRREWVTVQVSQHANQASCGHTYRSMQVLSACVLIVSLSPSRYVSVASWLGTAPKLLPGDEVLRVMCM